MKKALTYILSPLIIAILIGGNFANGQYTGLIEAARESAEDLQIKQATKAREAKMLEKASELESQGLSEEEISEALKEEFKKEFFDDISHLQDLPFFGEELIPKENASKNYEPSPIPKPYAIPGITQHPDAIKSGTYKKLLTDFTLPRIAIIIISFVGTGALIFLIIGGVRYVTSYGNDESLEKAKTQVIYSIVGLLLAIMSYTIVSIIINLKFVE